MSAPQIDQLLDRLVQTNKLDADQFAQQLGVTLRPTQDNPHWQMYEFDLPEGPLARGELRLARTGDKALLSLEPRDPAALTEADLDLERWGPLHTIDINPRIPPEGTDAYIYRVDGAQVTFQFTHASRRLRAIAVQYGMSQPQANSA